MIDVRQDPANGMRAMWLAVSLAMIAALTYLLIQVNVLPVGDLTLEERPPAIIYVAAGSYLLGGLLILLRWRWLWLVGAAINALVILFFVSMYQDQPAVLFSPGGLASKAAQLLLEVTLIYLIVADWRRPREKGVRGSLVWR